MLFSFFHVCNNINLQTQTIYDAVLNCVRSRDNLRLVLESIFSPNYNLLKTWALVRVIRLIPTT